MLLFSTGLLQYIRRALSMFFWNRCSNSESCRACENFGIWLNVEKYLSCITALRVGPARAVIGASSIVPTSSVAICLLRSFAVRALSKRGLCAPRLWTSYGKSVLFSAIRPTRAPTMPLRHLSSPALASFRRLMYSQQDSQRLSCYPCGLVLAGHLLLHRS